MGGGRGGEGGGGGGGGEDIQDSWCNTKLYST